MADCMVCEMNEGREGEDEKKGIIRKKRRTIEGGNSDGRRVNNTISSHHIRQRESSPLFSSSSFGPLGNRRLRLWKWVGIDTWVSCIAGVVSVGHPSAKGRSSLSGGCNVEDGNTRGRLDSLHANIVNMRDKELARQLEPSIDDQVCFVCPGKGNWPLTNPSASRGDKATIVSSFCSDGNVLVQVIEYSHRRCGLCRKREGHLSLSLSGPGQLLNESHEFVHIAMQMRKERKSRDQGAVSVWVDNWILSSLTMVLMLMSERGRCTDEAVRDKRSWSVLRGDKIRLCCAIPNP